MNRRAKLSLAAANDNGQKSKPSGFESVTVNSPESEARETSRRQRRSNTQGRAEATDDSVVAQPAWPTAGQVAKVLLVVTVCALGIYLLKRRFF